MPSKIGLRTTECINICYKKGLNSAYFGSKSALDFSVFGDKVQWFSGLFKKG